MRPRLYKYRPINEYTMRFLSEREVWLSQVTELNDLHEFASPVEFVGGSEADYREIIDLAVEACVNKADPELGTEQRSALRHEAQRMSLRERADFVREAAAGMSHWARRSAAVFCMTSRPDVPTMWAHYADGHRGICVEIVAAGILSEARQVLYCSPLPSINFFASTKTELRDHIALTKASDWSYEREWRVVRSASASFADNVEGPLLASVVFGYRAAESDIQRVVDAVDASGQEVTYFHARSNAAGWMDIHPK